MTIYFARFEDRGRWKIGYTSAEDARDRLRQALTFTPCTVSVVAQLEGGPEVERELHQRFRHLRVQLEGRDEIFENAPELEQFVEHVRRFKTTVGFEEALAGDESVARRGRANMLRRIRERQLADAAAEAEERRERLKRDQEEAARREAAALPDLKWSIQHSWGIADRFFGFDGVSDVPWEFSRPVADFHLGTRAWVRRDGCLEATDMSRSGVSDGLWYLSRATSCWQITITWIAMAFHEVEWEASRRNVSVGRLGPIPLLAAQELSYPITFHHQCSQVFPSAFAPLVAPSEESDLTLHGFICMARAHLDACLRRYAPTLFIDEGSFSEASTRYIRTARRMLEVA